MSVLTHRPPLLPTFPGWSDLMARFDAMPPWSSLEGHMIRVEESVKDGRYVLRAELPGVDPARDIEISVRAGELVIKAERTEEIQEDKRSEFRYGSFQRTVTLPLGAQEDDVNANYSNGILTVDVALPGPETETPARHIEVKTSEAPKTSDVPKTSEAPKTDNTDGDAA